MRIVFVQIMHDMLPIIPYIIQLYNTKSVCFPYLNIKKKTNCMQFVQKPYVVTFIKETVWPFFQKKPHKLYANCIVSYENCTNTV